MTGTGTEHKVPLCPSARPDWEGSIVHGVVGGTVDQPRVTYLSEPVPSTPEVLQLSGPVTPTEVFRFAAPCACNACRHFDGDDCRLVQRITLLLPTATERLPRCRIRPNCRWWIQEGKAACLRCPQVVTDSYSPSENFRAAAQPEPQKT